MLQVETNEISLASRIKKLLIHFLHNKKKTAQTSLEHSEIFHESIINIKRAKTLFIYVLVKKYL